ncbi:hypothetical protein D8B34_09135 [Verminephrobacter eiseniae]|uniref:3'-5' exonuclease n=1 Tax=Verminephrobacter eiseniae TaxID=364317 RepID=UPI0010EC65D7|nr:3'-5' exonuclease [Verminephrobacter eiseniae]KAB7603420.1 hypothetical protein ET532_011555 [Verminephrobacter sp. Larva24]MCW5233536.1 hypothetical protein [Verminephrobacter eiseniae]MCW5294909.1 hypothetical protein [Verminephrobacter eiseniae]MCW8183790.1 hypothetical protein [Verminephrobacter eiseniae]MCW8222334.1 hypothetical protein [Verminephrobacter eiseniae]
MQSTCRRTSAWRRTMTVAPVALVLSLAVLHPDCADDALEREHLAALVRQIELADRLANQLADQTAPYDATRDAGLAQVDSGGGYPFTHSFRFGPRVARIATDLLRMFYREQAAIEGLGPDTLITATPQGSPRAILARTNATVFQHAVKAIRCGQSLGFAGGVNAYGFEKLLDVNHLAQERHDRIRDDLIRTFPSFSHFMEYSKQSGDLEAKRQIEAVLAYGDELETLIPSIHQSAQTDLSKAFIVLATAHRAKGLTLDHVELADDFPELLDAVGAPLQADQLDRQEVNLLYVALTRPRLTLSLNRTTLEFVRKCGASGLLGDSWLVA